MIPKIQSLAAPINLPQPSQPSCTMIVTPFALQTLFFSSQDAVLETTNS
jgi:hypothetical protein